MSDFATSDDSEPDPEPMSDATIDEAVVEEPATEIEAESVDAEDAVVDVDDLLDEEEEAAAPPVESPYDRAGQWFVVHTQSGYEKKVKQNLEARISSMN